MTDTSSFRGQSMIKLNYLVFAVALFTTSTCLAGDKQAVVRLSEPVEQTAAYETFGEPLDTSVSPVTLENIAAEGDRYADTTIRVETRVARVCQKKGCFFIAQDGDTVVRVSFKDYGFFVPTNISGRRVTLVGTVVAREITPEQASHFAEDLGDTDAALRPGKVWEIVASSVRVPRG